MLSVKKLNYKSRNCVLHTANICGS